MAKVLRKQSNEEITTQIFFYPKNQNKISNIEEVIPFGLSDLQNNMNIFMK